MQVRLQILLALASLFVFFSILNNIRKGRLREEYSLIWLFCAAIIFIMAVFRGSLRLIADLLQISYAPSLVFMVGLGLVVAIQLTQTAAISKLTLQNRDLAQRIAFLEWHVRQMLNNYAVTEILSPDVEMMDPSQDNLEGSWERLEGNRQKYEEIEVFGDRTGWSYIRFVETVGSAGETADAAEASFGGHSG
jgi:hypothetical protein